MNHLTVHHLFTMCADIPLTNAKADVSSQSLCPRIPFFPFQLMPPELRKKIDRLALTTCDGITIRCQGIKAIRASDSDQEELGSSPVDWVHPKWLCLKRQIR